MLETTCNPLDAPSAIPELKPITVVPLVRPEFTSAAKLTCDQWIEANRPALLAWFEQTGKAAQEVDPQYRFEDCAYEQWRQQMAREHNAATLPFAKASAARRFWDMQLRAMRNADPRWNNR